MNSQKKGMSLWLKRNIIPVFLSILSIYFVFSGTVSVGVQKLNWISLVLFICTTMIFGVIISSLVAETGYTAGKKNEDFIATRAMAISLSEQALPWRDEANLYVTMKIDEGIEEDRREILALSGTKYEEVFSRDGVYLLTKEQLKKDFNKKQRKAIHKAKSIKKEDFSLFGFAAGKILGRKKAPNEVERRKKKTTTTFITRIGTAIVTGSIMFYFIGFNYASILYSIYQLLIWIGSGIVARIGNYNFIVIETREYDQDRIWYLKAFLALPIEEKQKYSAMLNKESVKLLTMKTNSDNAN